MKVIAIVAGRHNGNSEILAKEALLARKPEQNVNLLTYSIITSKCVPDVSPVPCRWVTSHRERVHTRDVS